MNSLQRRHEVRLRAAFADSTCRAALVVGHATGFGVAETNGNGAVMVSPGGAEPVARRSSTASLGRHPAKAARRRTSC